MTSFDDLLAARKAAKPRTVKVEVLLDTDASEQLEQLEAELEQAEASKSDSLTMPDPTAEIRGEIEKVKARTLGAVIVLEFQRLPGEAWADLTQRNAPREDSILDVNFGYNIDAVVQAAVMFVRGGHAFAWRVDGDGKTATLTKEQWDDLYTVLSGRDIAEIRDSVWDLNEWGPLRRLTEAKKALAGDETGSNLP